MSISIPTGFAAMSAAPLSALPSGSSTCSVLPAFPSVSINGVSTLHDPSALQSLGGLNPTHPVLTVSRATPSADAVDGSKSSGQSVPSTSNAALALACILRCVDASGATPTGASDAGQVSDCSRTSSSRTAEGDDSRQRPSKRDLLCAMLASAVVSWAIGTVVFKGDRRLARQRRPETTDDLVDDLIDQIFAESPLDEASHEELQESIRSALVGP